MSESVSAVDQGERGADRRALGELLVEKGLLDGGRLAEALRIGEESGERLGQVVVRLGWVSEDNLAKVLAEQWQLRYLDRSGISFDADALRRLSREEAIRLEALPMHVDGDGMLAVALAEPSEARLLALRDLLGDRIAPVVVPKTALDLGLRGDLLASRPPGTTAAQAMDPPHARDEAAGQHDAADPSAPPAGGEIADAVAGLRMLRDDLTSHLDALPAVLVDSLGKMLAESSAGGSEAMVEKIDALEQRLRLLDDRLVAFARQIVDLSDAVNSDKRKKKKQRG
jgi:MshEN domain